MNRVYNFSDLSTGALVALIVVFALLFVVMVTAYTNVISRAGYSRWWILILFVPVVDIVMILVFCFKEWPVTRQLREAQARAGQQYPGPPYGGQYGGQYPPTQY